MARDLAIDGRYVDNTKFKEIKFIMTLESIRPAFSLSSVVFSSKLSFSLSNSSKKKIDKAKIASNIALGYEMLDELHTSLTWITTAQTLFNESTVAESLERKRVSIYKTEIERRLDVSNKLNMQVD